MKIHPVMNIEHVKPFLHPREGQQRYKPGAVYIGEDGSEDFEVEEIVDSQMHKDKLQYLVKWVGWDSESNTWEPESHLANAPEALTAFHGKRTSSAPQHLSSQSFSSLFTSYLEFAP